MTNSPVPIGIAVVEHDGKYLVGTRPSDVHLAGRAEFPGGKCETGESCRDCAVRECLEETGLAVTPVERLLQREHQYPSVRVDLEFWLCRPADARNVRPDHRGYGWVASSGLSELAFPEANAPLLEILASRSSEAGQADYR